MRGTTERGYGAGHQQERARWQKKLDAGAAIQCSCARSDCPNHDGQCSTVITSKTDWDLGHNDDRTGYNGPECISCNRSAGGRNGNRVKREQSLTFSREW